MSNGKGPGERSEAGYTVREMALDVINTEREFTFSGETRISMTGGPAFIGAILEASVNDGPTFFLYCPTGGHILEATDGEKIYKVKVKNLVASAGNKIQFIAGTLLSYSG